MRHWIATVVGKFVRFVTHLRGGGTSLPGMIAERIDPRYLERASAKFPLGVLSILGSNGKTTTTNMVTAMLREHGLRVAGNTAGGNLPQGLATSMVMATTLTGRVPYDIAVLETDEAYAPQLAPRMKPVGSLLLNVQIDQLQRLHEPDRVGDMLRSMALETTGHVVINADSAHLRPVGAELPYAQPHYFAVEPNFAASLPNGLNNAEAFGVGEVDLPVEPAALVLSASEHEAELSLDGEVFTVSLPARGLHYAIDIAAAALLVKRVLGERFTIAAVQRAMQGMKTAYGRGEVLVADGQEIEMIMFKNGPSLQLNLDSIPELPDRILFTIDTGTPDLTWLYSNELSRIEKIDVVSGGLHASQLATHFAYRQIPVDLVEPDMKAAVAAFLALPAPTKGRKLMLVNYEQMALIRDALGYRDMGDQ